VSVTEVLRVIDKPQLMYWFGKQVYYAMAKDPTMNEKEALAAPYKINSDAKARGTTVHSIVESYKHTGDVVTNTPEPFKGYARAFEHWVRDFKPNVVEHERTVINTEHRYAGTLDMLADVDKEKLIIDVKTGKAIYGEAYLQLSAYLHGNVDAKGIAVLLLQENGTYTFERGEDKFDYFLAAKKLWEWVNADLIKTISY
jgi:hypothetical protein